MPSSPCCSAASSSICPSSYVGGTCQATSSRPSAEQPLATLGQRPAHRSSPSRRSRSKAIRVTGFFSASRRARVGVAHVHPVGERTEGRAPPRPARPPRRRAGSPRRASARRVQLGEGDGDVVLVARPDAQPASGAVHQDAHAVPLHLVGPARPRARGRPWSRASAAPDIQAGAGSVSSASQPGSGHPDHMRAIWKGAVSFGLVSVPVKLYSATESKDISFRQVHAKDGGRIKYQRTCSIDGEEVEYADIAKGYETEDGEMVILTDEDMDAAAGQQQPRDQRREVRAQRADRPDALREVLLPRAGEVRRQALRAAARGPRGRRPDGAGDGLAAQPDVAGGAARARRRDRDADDDVARRDPRSPTSAPSTPARPSPPR